MDDTMEFMDTKTCQNLARSFAGESQARTRYALYAATARTEGWEYLARIFEQTAANELAHAEQFLEKLQQHGKQPIENIDVAAGYPFTHGVTMENLYEAAHSEEQEFLDAYPAFAAAAREEGFPDVAALWEQIAKIEVKGAAIATVAGQIIAAIIGLFVNLKKNPEIHIRAKLVRWHGATAGEIYRVGVPSIIMGSIGSVMTFGMNKILIAFTTTATAVFGAYFKLQSFIFMPVFGLNNAMVPILSYNYGARKPERVKKTVKLSIFTAIGIMILGFAAFELIPDVLLELFDASETMLSIGTTALRIIGTHFLIAGINVVAMSVYQAVGDPLYSLLSSVTRQLVVLLPAAWLLARTGRLELVWLAFPIAELAALAMSAIFLRKTLRTAECRMADDDYGEVV